MGRPVPKFIASHTLKSSVSENLSYASVKRDSFNVYLIFNKGEFGDTVCKTKDLSLTRIIRKILDRCKIIHLGMQEDGRVYVVPTNYGYTYEDGKLTFYSHGAMEGKKWDIIKRIRKSAWK